jgi:hypothetical protein
LRLLEVVAGVRRRHHGAERHFNRAFWVGEETGNAGKRLARFGVKDVENGADQQRVAGLLPMIATFDRSLRVDQYVRDILEIARLPLAATNLQQWILRG